MNKLTPCEQKLEIKNFVLQDYRTGERVQGFDTEVEALYWYGCAMRVFGSLVERKLMLRQRRGVDYHILHDPNETYARALAFV